MRFFNAFANGAQPAAFHVCSHHTKQVTLPPCKGSSPAFCSNLFSAFLSRDAAAFAAPCAKRNGMTTGKPFARPKNGKNACANVSANGPRCLNPLYL